MKKYTGTIILGLFTIGFLYLALIFGIDTILSLGEHATISEFAHNWLTENPKQNLIILLSTVSTIIIGLIYLVLHFLWFKPKK